MLASVNAWATAACARPENEIAGGVVGAKNRVCAGHSACPGCDVTRAIEYIYITINAIGGVRASSQPATCMLRG